jgi:hypothetical protein
VADDWTVQEIPAPGVYTARSVEWGPVAEPVCDACVEAHYPAVCEQLLADRALFWAWY